jgi:hypothetical protein
MFSFTEYQCQSSLDKHGSVEIHTEYYTRKKPAWWVLLKLLGVAAMVAVGYGIALPTVAQALPLWQACAAVAGVMLIYVGIAFFFRPEPNTDNMGWFGGMSNDPTQYSDNINRSLWNLHCVLGPGRFTAETLLDLCVLLGLAKGDEILDGTIQDSAPLAEFECNLPAAASNEAAIAVQASAPLRADRFEQPGPGPSGGQMQLDSWRYLQPKA